MGDFAYVSDAVHFLTFPAERMGYTIHYGYFGAKQIFIIVEATAQPYEYVQALVSGALRIDYLTVYYILTVWPSSGSASRSPSSCSSRTSPRTACAPPCPCWWS